MQQMKDKINPMSNHQATTGHGGKKLEAHEVVIFSLWNPCPPPGGKRLRQPPYMKN